MSEAAELSEQHELEPSSPPRSVLASVLALPRELPEAPFFPVLPLPLQQDGEVRSHPESSA